MMEIVRMEIPNRNGRTVSAGISRNKLDPLDQVKTLHGLDWDGIRLDEVVLRLSSGKGPVLYKPKFLRRSSRPDF